MSCLHVFMSCHDMTGQVGRNGEEGERVSVVLGGIREGGRMYTDLCRRVTTKVEIHDVS